MAFTSPKMGLKVWNLLSDLFDHDQLADNWSKVDLHDHTLGRGIQIPTEGIADGAVTAAKLTASLIDTSPVVYREIVTQDTFVTAAIATGTYWLSNNNIVLSGASVAAQGVGLVPIVAADYAVTGKTTMLNFRTAWMTNAVAPTSTFTFGLYNVTSNAGAAGNLTVTTGALVTGSGTAIVAPAASSRGQVASVDFALPADDVYILACAISVGATAASSYTNFRTALRVHHV